MMQPYLFDLSPFADHLTDNAIKSLIHADQIARSFGSSYVGTEHILLGLLAQNNSVGAQLLGSVGVNLNRARLALNLTPKVLVAAEPKGKGLSETAKLTLKMSRDIAIEFNQSICGTEHILFSLLNQKNSRAGLLLRDMKIDLETLKNSAESYLNNQQFEQDDYDPTTVKKDSRKKGTPSALDYFGVNLTKAAARGKLDPLVGREHQLNRMITILARRNKNNPVLLGEAGVGKTAIVEGLAQRIADDQVPSVLIGKQIVALDLASLVAGTKYRGEFEGRLKKLMNELEDNPDVILFIDELHLIMGTGSAEGSMDAANMLKPGLARGKLRVIGATTDDEYSKFIESDGALDRRFQPVRVPEATLRESVGIIKGIRATYEKHHGVQIDEDLVEPIVKMAKRYVPDRRLPDKAVDLIDESAAFVRVKQGVISEAERKMQKALRVVQKQMEQAVADEDYERAALHKTRFRQLKEKINDSKAKLNQQNELKLTPEVIAEVLSMMTGISVSKVLRQEAQYLLKLESHLGKYVVGQNEAISAVAKAIRRNRSGVSDENRPVGSFIFLGPSGVGKTELARVMARELYDDEKALVKIDMSEFSERHTVSRLVGAPAGYVGYEEGGQLTDIVRRKPNSLILFDEIEKAHPEVFNILLQILEDGKLSDAKGRSVDFSNTVVIMTSNIGAESLKKEASLGFRATNKNEKKELDSLHNDAKDKVLEELKLMMRPELLNRIDKIIVFRALTNKQAGFVLDLQLSALSDRLNELHIGVSVSKKARNLLLQKGYTPSDGVRPLRRAIQDELEDHIAEGLLNGDYKEGDIVVVDVSKKEFTFSVGKNRDTKSH
jgi:ATP-dependent Clp protease ATP-binding subunit ClpC